jgi:hypothetical protein
MSVDSTTLDIFKNMAEKRVKSQPETTNPNEVKSTDKMQSEGTTQAKGAPGTKQAEPIIAPVKSSPEDSIFEALFMDRDGSEWPKIENILKQYLPVVFRGKLEKTGVANDYNVLLFLDQVNSIGEDHADRIYNAVSSFTNRGNILLIIGSKGGEIEPAYLISKNCRSSSVDRFVVSVPRRAKSAATLIALGASEIHMGSMSELGPIDPQLGQLPALAMNNALDTIAQLVSEYPKSSDMFAKYLESQLDLRILGYFKRINESAKQYAARLLEGKVVGDGFTPEKLAQHLVDHYNDHSFVIDNEEAIRLFGDAIVRCNTPEYHGGSEIEKFAKLVSNICRWIHNKETTFVGSIDDCLKVKDIKKS